MFAPVHPHSLLRMCLRLSVAALLLLASVLAACELRDEVITTEPGARLAFSRDTVRFDTVFTTLGSITRRLTVYNRNKKAVSISRITLAGGAASPYSMIVNGEPTAMAQNVRLLGNDSLLILVQVKLQSTGRDLPLLNRDSIVFETNGNSQHIKLLAWGQDANQLRNQMIRGTTIWSGSKPYLIYDTLVVAPSARLIIEEGTSVHLANNASVFIQGSLIIQGSAQKPVHIGGMRLDEPYKKVPGQWNGIFFTVGSKENKINHAVIRNGNFAFWLGTPDNDTIPDVEISNSIIENMAYAGVVAFTSDLSMNNTLVNNCARYTVAGIAGGNYTFRHCTFANYSNFFREQENASFALTTILERSSNPPLVGNLLARIDNCIIWGTLSNEIQLDARQARLEAVFRNNIMRTTNNALNINNNLLNRDPKFKNYREQNFRLDTLSPAKDAGVFVNILKDLKGENRDNKPDIGAYERIEKK